MKILTLSPSLRRLEYALFRDDWNTPVAMATVLQWAGNIGESLTLLCDEIGPEHPDRIVLRAPFGAEVFDRPILWSPETKRKLRALASAAPMHIPPMLALLDAVDEAFPGVPVGLFFETAFFIPLPKCEQCYAIAPDAIIPVRRYGYHGLFHEAAARLVRQVVPCSGGRTAAGWRILSMCLESRPEVAAIKADCPVMVTSGATPLEGLPGDHISGEIDPAIVSLLEAEHDYGPEQINAMLTQHSGIRGLTGEKYGLRDVFLRSGEEEMKAREIFLHRLLLATGAGLAAMGGLDAVVFSGANAGLAVHLRPWLESRLNRIPRLNSTSICWLSLEQGLHSVLATLGSMLAFPLAVDSPGGCRA